MAALKYSRQRESIQEFLNSSCEHPTADMVYLHVRKQYPNISLGTVYRNLNLLAELGEAIKILTPNGGVHFDGRTQPHYHFTCNCCGNVYDLDMKELECINDVASESSGAIIENHSLMFYGTCKNCINNK